MSHRVQLPAWLTEVLSDAEKATIDVVTRRFGTTNEIICAAAGLTVLAQRQGHSCVDISDISSLIADATEQKSTSSDLLSFYSLDQFLETAEMFPHLIRVVHSISSMSISESRTNFVPFILLNHYLYSQRQFIDELSIATQIHQRSSQPALQSFNKEIIDSIVPVPAANDTEAQKVGDTGIANRAAHSFASRNMTVLTGGPGTGKTFTLTRCIGALLSSRNNHSSNLRIALVAPTGKAAARAKEMLTEFVQQQSSQSPSAFNFSAEVLQQMATIEPKTIHRLLGNKDRKRTRFAFHADRLLDIDVLVVDEMSMVPSYLMARLLEATRIDTTILLVGDQAQLEAVESGSVLREIVDSAINIEKSSEWVFELRRVFRQSSDTQIGDLARFIRSGESHNAMSLVSSGGLGITMSETGEDDEISTELLQHYITVLKEAHLLAKSTDQDAHKRAHQIISQNKLLCGPRMGAFGIYQWNQKIGESVLDFQRDGQLDVGIPILITINSVRTRLVNGDIGIVVNVRSDDKSGNKSVFFLEGDTGRYLSVSELPEYEMCFAMTIHKSQGSEYQDLTIILPHQDSPLLNRELVYTAVTRAKKSLTIIGSTAKLGLAIGNQSKRHSGLRSMLINL